MVQTRRSPVRARSLDTTALNQLLGFRLAMAAIPSFAVFEQAVGVPFDLRRVDFTVLTLLRTNDEVTLKDLCVSLRASAPHFSVVVDRLVRRNLVQRVQSSEDRRVNHLGLTSDGQALADRVMQAAVDMERDVLSRLSAAEVGMLFELLAKAAQAPLPAGRDLQAGPAAARPEAG